MSWGYDWAGRLTSEVRTGSNAYSTAYTLDAEGRRTSQSVTSGGTTKVTNFTVDSDDEVTAASSSSGGLNNSYSYNSNGEQTGRTLAGTAYTAAFDYDGQMTSLTQGSSTTSFAYDALGRRVSRTAGGTTTAFQYDGGSVLLEKQGSTTTGTYTYGVGIIRKDGETPLYDGIGSARAETNSSQSVTSTLTPDAFGNAVATTGSTGNSYQFGATSGYRNDGDAGLLKVGCRYYDPQVGAFTTRDTYLDQKPYLYCEHDPVNAVDPSGHDPILTVSTGAIGGFFPIAAWTDLNILIDLRHFHVGIGADVGMGGGFGVGGSAGVGVGISNGTITTGQTIAVTVAGFLGLGMGGSGNLSYSTDGPSASGGVGKMGPTVGGGLYLGVTRGYVFKLF